VLGSCRRSLVGRVLIGNDTHDALNGASCAVAIAPAGYGSEHVAMREIGVGYDESPESDHALDVARDLAAYLGAKLSVLEVVSMPQYLLRDGSISLDASIEDYVNAASFTEAPRTTSPVRARSPLLVLTRGRSLSSRGDPAPRRSSRRWPSP